MENSYKNRQTDEAPAGKHLYVLFTEEGPSAVHISDDIHIKRATGAAAAAFQTIGGMPLQIKVVLCHGGRDGFLQLSQVCELVDYCNINARGAGVAMIAIGA